MAGPDYDYTHKWHGLEHKLELVDAQDEHPERGMVLIYVNGRTEVCHWMPWGKH